MAAAEAVRALSLGLILLLLVVGRLDIGWLAALGFLGACGTVVYGIAAPAADPGARAA